MLTNYCPLCNKLYWRVRLRNYTLAREERIYRKFGNVPAWDGINRRSESSKKHGHWFPCDPNCEFYHDDDCDYHCAPEKSHCRLMRYGKDEWWKRQPE